MTTFADAIDMTGSDAFVLCVERPDGEIDVSVETWNAAAMSAWGDLEVIELPHATDFGNEVMCFFASDWQQNVPGEKRFRVAV